MAGFPSWGSPGQFFWASHSWGYYGRKSICAWFHCFLLIQMFVSESLVILWQWYALLFDSVFLIWLDMLKLFFFIVVLLSWDKTTKTMFIQKPMDWNIFWKWMHCRHTESCSPSSYLIFSGKPNWSQLTPEAKLQKRLSNKLWTQLSLL